VVRGSDAAIIIGHGAPTTRVAALDARFEHNESQQRTQVNVDAQD